MGAASSGKTKVVFACTTGSGTTDFAAYAFERFLELKGAPLEQFEIVRTNFSSKNGMAGVSAIDPVIIMDHLRGYAEESIAAGILKREQVFRIPNFLYSPELIAGVKSQPIELRRKFGVRNLKSWGNMVLQIVRKGHQPKIRQTKPLFTKHGDVYRATFLGNAQKPITRRK